jgi:hypothetical protein
MWRKISHLRVAGRLLFLRAIISQSYLLERNSIIYVSLYVYNAIRESLRLKYTGFD